MVNFTYKGSVQDLIGSNDGNNVYDSSSVVANRSGSLLERLQDLIEQSERTIATGAALLTTGTTVFTVAGGPIKILELVSICQVGSDSTAATLQWSADGTLGSATTFTGASASRASQAAGDAIVCNFTALTTAPDLVANGVGLAAVGTRGIIVPAGIITSTVGSGPTTTGTYKHYIRFKPLAPGVSVTPAF